MRELSIAEIGMVAGGHNQPPGFDGDVLVTWRPPPPFTSGGHGLYEFPTQEAQLPSDPARGGEVEGCRPETEQEQQQRERLEFETTDALFDLNTALAIQNVLQAGSIETASDADTDGFIENAASMIAQHFGDGAGDFARTTLRGLARGGVAGLAVEALDQMVSQSIQVQQARLDAARTELNALNARRASGCGSD